MSGAIDGPLVERPPQSSRRYGYDWRRERRREPARRARPQSARRRRSGRRRPPASRVSGLTACGRDSSAARADRRGSHAAGRAARGRPIASTGGGSSIASATVGHVPSHAPGCRRDARRRWRSTRRREQLRWHARRRYLLLILLLVGLHSASLDSTVVPGLDDAQTRESSPAVVTPPDGGPALAPAVVDGRRAAGGRRRGNPASTNRARLRCAFAAVCAGTVVGPRHVSSVAVIVVAGAARAVITGDAGACRRWPWPSRRTGARPVRRRDHAGQPGQCRCGGHPHGRGAVAPASRGGSARWTGPPAEDCPRRPRALSTPSSWLVPLSRAQTRRRRGRHDAGPPSPRSWCSMLGADVDEPTKVGPGARLRGPPRTSSRAAATPHSASCSIVSMGAEVRR